MTPVVKLLLSLISLPSINPAIGKSRAWQGEERVIKFLAAYLDEHDANVQIVDLIEQECGKRQNLIARFAPLDGRPRVFFGPHSDTVGVENMKAPFIANLRDGKIYGRGACDTKGPMAAMLCALIAEKDFLRNSPVAVDLVVFADEEFTQIGSKHFAQSPWRNDYHFAFIGEPTSLDYIYAQKGTLWCTLQASGVSGHTSRPNSGVNAIEKLAETFPDLRKRLHERLPSFSNDILGTPTMSITKIRGGESSNSIPANAELELDLRITPEFVNQVGGPKHIFEEICKDYPKVQIKQFGFTHPVCTSLDHPLIDYLKQAHPHAKFKTSASCSDAAQLAPVGLPSLTVGPGNTKYSHRVDEHIQINELELGVDQYRSIIRAVQNFKPVKAISK